MESCGLGLAFQRRGVSPVTFAGRHPGYLSREANKRGNAHAGGEVFSGPGNDHKPHLPRWKPDRRQHLAARSDQAAEQGRTVEGPWHDAAEHYPHFIGVASIATPDVSGIPAPLRQSHLSAATGTMSKKTGPRNMSSQEELVGCLRQLTEALASHHARRLSIVRQHDRPLVAGADEARVGPDQDGVDQHDRPGEPKRRA
jgi:hypothetical protein